MIRYLILFVGVLFDLSVAYSPTALPSHVSNSMGSQRIASITSRTTFMNSMNRPISMQKCLSSSSLSMGTSDDDNVVGNARIISCLPYLLPILDGDRYGKYIFYRFPPVGTADAILLGPLKTVWTSIPYVNIVAFFLLLTLIRNTDIPRSVRFNMQQALLLDITLIFPSLLGEVVQFIRIAPPQFVMEPATNFVFYYLVAVVGYSVISNLTGKTPNQIPVLSEAAEIQVGPF